MDYFGIEECEFLPDDELPCQHVSLISNTQNPENIMSYVARVSSPVNQVDKKDNYKGLLSYCIRNKHWSVFEQADMTLEINTTIAISRQLLRHRSFTFQEFSQRYAEIEKISCSDLNPRGIEKYFEIPKLRRQDNKNRQNSLDNLDPDLVKMYQSKIEELFAHSLSLYSDMIEDGVAKECARFVLPMSTKTRLYMKGNCRSWIHYIKLRSGNGTQTEHKEIAEECKKIFKKVFPIVAEALGW